jgi:hypothetical protein
MLGVALDSTTTPLASTASDQEFCYEHRTGVAVPRKNTVPQNRYDGKADDPLATDQIRSENQASAGVPRLEFHVPCHPQRRCKEYAFRTRKGPYRSSAKHDCRPGRFLRQVHFRIVQRTLDSARACAENSALSELWACSRRQQKNRLAGTPNTDQGCGLRRHLNVWGGWAQSSHTQVGRGRANWPALAHREAGNGSVRSPALPDEFCTQLAHYRPLLGSRVRS